MLLLSFLVYAPLVPNITAILIYTIFPAGQYQIYLGISERKHQTHTTIPAAEESVTGTYLLEM